MSDDILRAYGKSESDVEFWHDPPDMLYPEEAELRYGPGFAERAPRLKLRPVFRESLCRLLTVRYRRGRWSFGYGRP